MCIKNRIPMKLLALFLLVGFMFVAISPARAENNYDISNPKEVIFSKAPITDEAVLYENAKNGKTDLIGDANFIQNIVLDEDLLKEFCVENCVTTQKLKEVRETNPNGSASRVEDYTTTIFTDIYENGSSYKQVPKVDPQTASVRCTLTVRYSYRWDQIGSFNYYSATLDRVDSKWTILDSQMSILKGYVRGTAYGYKVTSFNPHQSGSLIKHLGTNSGEYRYISYPSSGTTYTYYPSWSDWLDVYPLSTHVGGQADITIKRNATGSTWTLSHQVRVNYTDFPL